MSKALKLLLPFYYANSGRASNIFYNRISPCSSIIQTQRPLCSCLQSRQPFTPRCTALNQGVRLNVTDSQLLSGSKCHLPIILQSSPAASKSSRDDFEQEGDWKSIRRKLLKLWGGAFLIIGVTVILNKKFYGRFALAVVLFAYFVLLKKCSAWTNAPNPM